MYSWAIDTKSDFKNENSEKKVWPEKPSPTYNAGKDIPTWKYKNTRYCIRKYDLKIYALLKIRNTT